MPSPSVRRLLFLALGLVVSGCSSRESNVPSDVRGAAAVLCSWDFPFETLDGLPINDTLDAVGTARQRLYAEQLTLEELGVLGSSVVDGAPSALIVAASRYAVEGRTAGLVWPDSRFHAFSRAVLFFGASPIGQSCVAVAWDKPVLTIQVGDRDFPVVIGDDLHVVSLGLIEPGR